MLLRGHQSTHCPPIVPPLFPPSFRLPLGDPVTGFPLTSKAHSGLPFPAGMLWGPCLPLMLSSSSSSSSVPLAPAAKNINQHLEASGASLSGQKRDSPPLSPLLVALLLPKEDKKPGRVAKFKTGRKTLVFFSRLSAQQRTNSPAGAGGTRSLPGWLGAGWGRQLDAREQTR